ncbi:hypothetical protein SAMN05421846_104229 [Chryseobacterium taeanense]|uniref:Uncharacterized protein n=1 Tax=Chryseobacterium taeanense TaxID=311334 RepID=A0A1G8I6S8_9FLAO|nr:hypothetical protein [Chryseobacterium taeanense]SDI14461.1 hypothetical protein SAMN05421846_104229 [Chryseobacterium taeanense]
MKNTKSSVSETGHSKNIANLQDLISFCTAYGDKYNPVKEELKISSLEVLYEDALLKLNDAQTKKTLFDNATNQRVEVFKELNPLATKVINALAVSETNPLMLSNAKSYNKKLQGRTKAKPETEKSGEETENPTRTISTSQQSYDSKINHFSNLIQVLEQSAAYNPNEEELKTSALQDKLADMKNKNTALIHANTEYSNARLSRDQVLYNDLTGLCQIAKEVKQYVKSVFGAISPQYKQISSILFTKVKS